MTEAVPGPVTVLLVDDHAVSGRDLAGSSRRHGDIVVVGETDYSDTAQVLFRDLVPQIVVMDIALPGRNGIEALRRMLAIYPQTRVLIFSMHEETIFAEARAPGWSLWLRDLGQCANLFCGRSAHARERQEIRKTQQWRKLSRSARRTRTRSPATASPCVN